MLLRPGWDFGEKKVDHHHGEDDNPHKGKLADGGDAARTYMSVGRRGGGRKSHIITSIEGQSSQQSRHIFGGVGAGQRRGAAAAVAKYQA